MNVLADRVYVVPGIQLNQPYSIRIFLPDGDPDGLRTIEKSNWNGSGIMIPRPLFAAAKKRRELGRTGVYVLSGPPESSGLPRVYIGEGDPIGPRLDQHASKRDFWTSCVAFTSKDENLNKAHVQHIEARLVALASKAKRCQLENGTSPTLPSMSEADAADAEGFLCEMLLCFPVLGVSVFSVGTSSAVSFQELFVTTKGIRASGYETHDGFLVRSGSAATKEDVPSAPAYQRQLKLALVDNGVLEDCGSHYRFSQDYVFSSPSTAAGIVQGRSANGRVEWKTAEGITLRDLQATAPAGEPE